MKGDGRFQGEAFDITLTMDSADALSNKLPAAIKLDLASPLGTASYEGTLQTYETARLTGTFSASSEALQALAAFLKVDTGFDLAALGAINAKGSVEGPVETLIIKLDEVKQTSDLLKTSFTGDLAMGSTPQVKGALTVSAPSVAALAAFAKIDLPVQATPLGGLNATATLSGPMASPNLTFENLAVKSKLMTASYAGTVTLGEKPLLNGSFKADMANAGALATELGIKLEAPQLFEKVAVTGNLKGPADQLALTGISLTHVGQNLTASYKGAATLSEPLRLDGDVTAIVPQAGDFARAMKIELPGANAIERLEVSGKLKGAVETLELSGLDIQHSGALIDAAYKGSMKLGGDGALNGNFSARSEELRGLLKATEVDMAPGETLQRFAAKGSIKGSFKQLDFTGLDLSLDAIKASGTAGLDLRQTKPRLTGVLAMDRLDLTPFLGAPDATKPTGFAGWSKDPLDLAGLKAVDANLQIKTNALKIGNVDLTNASVIAKLGDGRLEANLPAFQAFKGTWSGKLNLDASGNVPALSFSMQGNSVEMAGLLGTLANFNRLDGAGNFRIEAAGRGASIDAIMKDLDGDVATNLKDGALKGFNVAQAVRSAQTLREAISTGNLRNLDFGGVLTPATETAFTQFDSVLKIQDGVAKVDLMKLLNPVLGIDGTGTIDLGWQKIDVRLATAIDKKASGSGSVIQLNGIPVPVRISGNWAALKVTPDLSGVETALKNDLGGRVREGITERVGGTGGKVISDVIGLPKRDTPVPTPTPAPDAPQTPATEPVKPPPPTLEDLGKKKAKETLDGLLGKKKPPAPTPAPIPPPPVETTPVPEPTPEPVPDTPPVDPPTE